MSYQVLARKWRPQTFADVVGQEHVLTALANGLSLGRIHHAYLFSGTRGVGKTSIARLLAKGLNCETGITATPCGVCDNCREIEQGRFVDLIEIDAASRTKVEDTRDLLDNVQYAPARGRFKVYLIDEVHMLSRHSFNALLKLWVWALALYRSVNRANCRVKPSVKLTTWNTAPISWRSTLMPSNRATKFWWWTTCWQPAALSKRPLN